MSIALKCKICGGDLESTSTDIAVCQYCGTKQILPKMTSERKANLYDRANHYRSINEFDKAFGIYEQIVAEDATDAEVYWDLVLCRYGIEYVEDPRTKKRIPTVNRTQYQSIYEDVNYKVALKHASVEQKEVIEEDAAVIDRIQKGILIISSKEQPYDIFICYKETDEQGRRTPDSVIAQDMYDELTKEGYKVFFSRITLEDKLGTAYEPYIFAALNSAKLMVVVGTKSEYFNAVWVKNEWSRYLGLINAGEKKVLIPAYKDMDPYDLPEEFSHLQAQDMSKLGFMQDIVRGINKIINPISAKDSNALAGIDVDAYKKRIDVFLHDGDYKSAKEYCDKVLDVRPEDADIYVQRLCADLEINSKERLGEAKKTFDNNSFYQNALRFSNATARKELEKLASLARDNDNKQKIKMRKRAKKTGIVVAVLVLAIAGIFIVVNAGKANKMMKLAEKDAEKGEFITAYEKLYDVGTARKENAKLVDYIEAGVDYQNGEYSSAKEKFEKLSGYKDSDKMALQCRYYELRDNIDQTEVYRAKKTLTELMNAGVEDTDDLQSKLEYRKHEYEFNKSFDNENYSSCKILMDSWKTNYPEIAKEFVSSNQEKWYKKAMDLINEKSPDVDIEWLNKIENLLRLCDSSYKDVNSYLEVLKTPKTDEGNSSLFGVCSSNILAKRILWMRYRDWFVDNWKTADGTKNFKLYIESDGTIYSQYTIPWFDTTSTYFEIDSDGTYYVHDTKDETYPYVTRRDMFKFEIISKTQVKVYCCKDGSTYMLYKQ